MSAAGEVDLSSCGVHADGQLKLSVSMSNGITSVSELYQQTPLRVLFPRTEVAEPLTAVVVNSSGGVVGGDRLEVSVEVGDGASLLVTGQAEEKIYRSSGAEATVVTTLVAGAGSIIEFLPQGTIVFDAARFRRLTVIDGAPGSRVMAGEMLTLGRVERGEKYSTGRLHDEWRVLRNGRLAWSDALHLSDSHAAVIRPALESPAGFNGSPGYATFIYMADDAVERVESARKIQDQTSANVQAGVTSFDGLLVARWLGDKPEDVRTAFGIFWAQFRASTCGYPERLPTIWNI